jgi:Zn-dependent membrane protease YugP
MILLLFLLTGAISLAAHFYLKSVYARHSQTRLLSGYTGADVAQAILSRGGIHDVSILEHEEMLGDHYDPMRKRLVLSSANYHGTSAAALGVAAHECGHALQHQQAYFPLQLRMAAVGVTNFASQIVLWVPLLGILTGLLAPMTGFLLMAIAWGIMMAFNLITLPVEFDASRRAKHLLNEMGFIQAGSERAAVAKVLNAAAWTYVAAFITSLVYFLWYLLPLLAGRDRD